MALPFLTLDGWFELANETQLRSLAASGRPGEGADLVLERALATANSEAEALLLARYSLAELNAVTPPPHLLALVAAVARYHLLSSGLGASQLSDLELIQYRTARSGIKDYASGTASLPSNTAAPAVNDARPGFLSARTAEDAAFSLHRLRGW